MVAKRQDWIFDPTRGIIPRKKLSPAPMEGGKSAFEKYEEKRAARLGTRVPKAPIIEDQTAKYTFPESEPDEFNLFDPELWDTYQPPDRDRRLRNTVTRLYPDVFKDEPDITTDRILTNLSDMAKTDPDAFLRDLFSKQMPQDAGYLLRQFGLEDEEIIGLQRGMAQETQTISIIQTVFPEVGSIDQFNTLLDKEPERIVDILSSTDVAAQDKKAVLLSLGLELQEVHEVLPEVQLEDVWQEKLVTTLLPEETKLPDRTWLDRVQDIGDDPIQLVPFISSGKEFFTLGKLLKTALDLENNRDVSVEDLLSLQEYVAESQRNTDFGYKVADVVSQLLPFGLEILLTGGIFGLGAKVGVKGAQAALKKIATKSGAKILERKLAQLGVKVVGGLVGGTAQAGVIGLAQVPAGTVEKQLQATLTGEEESVLKSVVKSFGETWVEVVSERTGGLFGKLGTPFKGALIKRGLFSAFIKANPGKDIGALRKVFNKMGYNGVVNEMLEERVADVGHGILYELGLGDQKFSLPSLEQLGVELVSVSIPGVAGRVTEIPAVKRALGEERGAIGRPEEAPEEMMPSTSVQVGLEGFGKEAAQAKMLEEFGTAPGAGGKKETLVDAEAIKRAEEAKPLPGQYRLERKLAELGEAEQRLDEYLMGQQDIAIEKEIATLEYEKTGEELEEPYIPTEQDLIEQEEQARKDLKYYIENDPIAQYKFQKGRKTIKKGGELRDVPNIVGLTSLIDPKEKEFPETFTVKQARYINPTMAFLHYTQKGTGDYDRVPRDVVFDELANASGISVDELANRVEQIAEAYKTIYRTELRHKRGKKKPREGWVSPTHEPAAPTRATTTVSFQVDPQDVTAGYTQPIEVIAGDSIRMVGEREGYTHKVLDVRVMGGKNQLLLSSTAKPEGSWHSGPFAELRKTEPVVEAPVVAEEIFPGINAVPEPIVEEVIPIAPPVKPPPTKPQTVDIPEPPPRLIARTRIIQQSEEVVKQSLPGAVNILFQKIPGIKQIMQWERPALRAFAENNPQLVVAQVAESAARSDVASRQVSSLIPLYKRLHNLFGEKALRGEKTYIKFIGTEEQAKSPITGTLIDIFQNPDLYELAPIHKATIQAVNEHNDASLNYVVSNYGAEIGRFTPKPGGAFLSNVDIGENIVDYLGSESRAIAKGRGKTRYWATARDRMESDKTFKPETNIKKLIEGMDSFKASAAGGQSFREVVGGLTRLEAMKETHPELYNKMMSLRKELQSFQGSLARLKLKLADRINEFLESPVEDTDLATLQEELDVQLETGKRVGLNIEQAQALVNELKAKIKELRPAWKIANLKPYVFVQEGLYRYFPTDQAKYIVDSRQITNNPILNFIEKWRGQAFSGDLSPFTIQGVIGVLADPIGSLQATSGGVKAAFENRDFLHSISLDGLVDDINSDIEGWAEFSSLLGRTLTGVPKEYAAGFLSTIPGFDKFTETTYITVTRGTKNLYDRTWQGLVKSGVPILEAKVAAIEVAQKVYPLVNPSKLGQSQKRAALLRAMPTSYSFIRQPVTLIAQGSMGFAKLITGQKLSPQERIATRVLVTMAASTMAVSATSAAISAKAQGKDDDEILQSVLDAINPDPYNGKFLSIIIGDFRIPLGGPYRSIFRAMYPQPVKGIPYPVPFAGVPRFIVNRITPAIKTQINLLRNADYYGRQIVKGEFPENIIRGVLYEVEGALPLSLSEIMGGMRREETLDEIVQQAATQFVGVNLMKLNNTYFHKLTRNLGLPKKEQQGLYELEIPKFTTRDLWSAVTRVLSDVSLEEIQQRKGYPELIRVIMETRDLKKNTVDILPNHSPVSIGKNKFTTYYGQWSQREILVAEGDDAEYTTSVLIGGRYKTTTYNGADALKKFDQDNPQVVALKEYLAIDDKNKQANPQVVALKEYWAIDDKNKQAQFIKDNPIISINPRKEYLKTHPKDNALLALWGQEDILTREAYTEFKKLVTQYDIPPNAIPPTTIPKTDGRVDNHFKYLDMVNEGTHTSVAADLLLMKDDIASKEAGEDSYVKWRTDIGQPLTLVDKPIEYLQLRVDNSELYDKLDAIKEDDTLDDEGKKEARATLRDTVVGTETFGDVERRVDAMNKGTRDNPIADEVVNAHVEYMKIIDIEGLGTASPEAKLFLIDNGAYLQSRMDEDLWGTDYIKEAPDMAQEPKWRLQVQYRPEEAKYKAIRTDYKEMSPIELASLGVPDGMNADTWALKTVEQKQGWLSRRDEAKFYEDNPKYRDASLNIQAYEIGLTGGNIDKWVERSLLPLSGYKRDRFGRDNPDFFTAVTNLQRAKGEKPWDAPPLEIPSIEYDNITEQYQDEFDEWDSYGDPESPDFIADSKGRLAAREPLKIGDDGYLTEFGKAMYRREAYEKIMPEEQVENFVDFRNTIKPDNWEDITGTDLYYEDQWFMQDNPDFYKDVYLNPKYWTDPHTKMKFDKVPTREVFKKYVYHLTLSEGKERNDDRWDNLDLDEWLVRAFGYVSVIEQRRRASKTVGEKTVDQIEELTRRLAGIS